MNENWDGVVCSFPLILLETSLHLDRIILFMGLYLDAVRRCPFSPSSLLPSRMSTAILLSPTKTTKSHPISVIPNGLSARKCADNVIFICANRKKRMICDWISYEYCTSNLCVLIYYAKLLVQSRVFAKYRCKYQAYARINIFLWYRTQMVIVLLIRLNVSL